jgi:probable F420-dependent oxidoreductase
VRFYIPAGSDAAAACSVSMPDHLFMPEPIEQAYPYRDDGKFVYPIDAAWPDVWVTIAAMAAVTERVRFRSNVYLASLRHPVVAARAIATAAVISDGRIEVGVGLGWLAAEYEAVGLDFAKRGAILDEAITALRTLWQPGPVRHEGTTWQFGPLYLNPIPPSPVPILVGGTSEPALRRAAQLGNGYVGTIADTEQALATTARVRALREQSDRAGEPFEAHLCAKDARTVDDYARIADHAIDAVMVVLPAATPEERVASMEAFARDVIEPFRARP